MDTIEQFVKDKLNEQIPEGPTVPISFRGHELTVVTADILADILGFSTRSKLLADLVPAALYHAIDTLPPELIELYNERFTAALKERQSK